MAIFLVTIQNFCIFVAKKRLSYRGSAAREESRLFHFVSISPVQSVMAYRSGDENNR